MILAAGLGTRLKPFTDEHPKALAVVNGKTLLQRNIEYLQQYDIKEVIVNVHHFADQIKDIVAQNNGWGSTISFSDETGAVLETGGGLLKAAPFFEAEENFVLMNVDILSNIDLTKLFYRQEIEKNIATLAVSKRTTSRYFLFNGYGHLCGWENVNSGEQKITRFSDTMVQRAFSGIHFIDTKIFPLIKQRGKFSMVDVYLDLSKKHNIGYYDHSGAKFMDVGNIKSIEKAEGMFK
ncbi:MAG: nucleotidyltransferase family protein [Arachidicoccus sp.]